jgi:hypothetical protein
MKILRSVNRRGFRIQSAGWFNVLTPNTWFPASRLPEDFHYLVDQSKGTAVAQTHDNSTENLTAAPLPKLTSVQEQKDPDSHETVIPQIMIPSTHDRHLMRTALIVLVAIVISYFLLWWVPFA